MLDLSLISPIEIAGVTLIISVIVAVACLADIRDRTKRRIKRMTQYETLQRA